MTHKKSPSTTEVGDSFRDLVCELLRTQFPDAQPEQYVNGTKVDVLFTRVDFGRTDRMAVECKSYETPLTKTYIEEKIWPKYQRLLDAGYIDGVLIVSRKPVGSAAADSIKGWRYARHLTIQELEESLLGIRKYVQTLAGLQPIEEASYVEARFDGHDGAALEKLQAWVSSPAGNGLAILGSYGQGKTSLARRVAGYYANAYLADPTQRIPIIKKLGEVVHETRLEALFGAEFTADSPAPGYQFKTFDYLNQTGRLLVILDGFDEMKHAMTASDFFSNFREFNRLLKGQSKVILLGRPNALPSDAQDLVFRGIRRVGGQSVASTEFNQWQELTLAFFNEAERQDLLFSNLKNIVSRYQVAGRFTYKSSFVEERTAEVLDRVPPDLLARPVHVQLISELAADPSFDFGDFTRYRLYDHFIRSMVERDTTQKRARKAIPLGDRLQFQRDVAWWAWRRIGKVQGSFGREEIPNSLLAELPDGNATDLEGKRNEYIVSTLTEEKDSGVLYFAHRSFQEFLVAERLRLAKPDPNAHAEYSAHITPDIISFLNQTPDLDYVMDWYDTLRSSPGLLSPSYLLFYSRFPRLIENIEQTALRQPAQVDMWTVAIIVLAHQSKTPGSPTLAQLDAFLLQVLRLGQDDAAATATLALLQRQQSRFSSPMLLALVGGLIERCLRRARPESDPSALSIEAKQFDFSAKWLGHTVEKVFAMQGKLDAAKLQFNPGKLIALCAGEVNDRMPEAVSAFGEVRESAIVAPVSVETQKVYEMIDLKLRKAHDGFLRNRRTNFVVVSYDRTRRAGNSFKPH
ncbi:MULTISPECIES: NACHT domain-containing protein [unclassified Polaromonas]|uniref:NACHT domain-containing protein n=1 Tax=unclassified Polaromonas TaxID=2638319 RepID=UPI0025CFF2A9|nr:MULTISPECIES: NACHT domain-containing protein [unclassified Polaromonas]HQR97641.1 NACHT domain-containing protein [Polaromonas sp.]HQS40135.1 NACHT domain-containing protein [Polaromonas sp.]HQS85425.1 NACHT domain-containing protein [Polaromonas sp.]HQT08745.1 NACHT domain-containing protein [Polaromonas sp.]